MDSRQRALRESASHESAETGPQNGATLEVALPAAVLEAVAERAAQLVAERLAAVDADRWMSVDEAAAHLACGPRRIYDLHSQRRVRAYKDGSRLLFRRSDLDAYVEAGS